MVNKRKSRSRSRKGDDCPLLPFSIDDCPESVPAAGWRNGTSLNNAGENGNYWSATPNESDTQNAYNLNFNSGNHNVNWNNRNNGHSVRPVSELTPDAVVRARPPHGFSISKEQLLADLYVAYRDARCHKRGKAYQLKFEYRLEDNLVALRDELLGGRYRPLPSTSFIIHEPKMREVFAAQFRDRIVHHLFYNYTHVLFERTFIYDSYSCIKHRGTHFGISRLRHHIRSVSRGYSRPCYVLKVDVRGYFMSIDRSVLLGLCRDTLARMCHRPSDVVGKTWGEVLDLPFVDYLLETIVNTDPTVGCHMLGDVSEWCLLPPEKSMYHAVPGRGLPIGNLSSQLFSNVYMNAFDQYVKRTLACRHYGRYVDDAYIVAESRDELRALIPRIAAFLAERLGLALHPHKTRIYDVAYGVEFLGAYLKPFRTYVSASSMRRIRCKAGRLQQLAPKRMEASVNSFLGVLSHYESYCLRRVYFGYQCSAGRMGRFDGQWLRWRR